MQASRNSPSESDPSPGPAEESPSTNVTSSTCVTATDSPSWIGPDRRRADRRQQPMRPWARWRGPLRRAGGRRQEDRRGYVDVYSRRDVALLLAIFLLNVGDAFFTLRWLGRGGREANPVMDLFLDIGPGAFLVQKCLVVGGWLLVLVIHKNYRVARLGLYTAFAVYAALMVVHFGIIAFRIEPPRPNAEPAGPVILQPDASDRGDAARPVFYLERRAPVPASERAARPAAE